MNYKTCNRCKKEKSIEEFHMNGNTRRPSCAECLVNNARKLKRIKGFMDTAGYRELNANSVFTELAKKYNTTVPEISKIYYAKLRDESFTKPYIGLAKRTAYYTEEEMLEERVYTVNDLSFDELEIYNNLD